MDHLAYHSFLYCTSWTSISFLKNEILRTPTRVSSFATLVQQHAIPAGVRDAIAFSNPGVLYMCAVIFDGKTPLQNITTIFWTTYKFKISWKKCTSISKTVYLVKGRLMAMTHATAGVSTLSTVITQKLGRNHLTKVSSKNRDKNTKSERDSSVMKGAWIIHC